MRDSRRRGAGPVVVLLVVLALALAACGGSQRVGSEELTRFKEQEVKRLGEQEKSPEPDPSQPSNLQIGGQSPSPSPSASPTPQEKFFDVFLVPDSPYYEPGNELHTFFGVTLRVTNRDGTDTRPFRSFAATPAEQSGCSIGAASRGFVSPKLRPGGAPWTFKLNDRGCWKITDESDEHNYPFIFASLEAL